MNMKISLVVPNYMCSRTFLQPPVELYTCASLLEKQGHAVEVYDFRVLNKTAQEASEIVDQNTDLIIISVSPYDMTQMYHMDYRYRYVEHFVKNMKEAFPNVYVFGEGAQCTLKPESFINNTGADGVILWEIERTVCELAKCIEKGSILNETPNLVIKDANTCVRSKYCEDYAHPSVEYFDVIPKWELVDFSQYFGYDLQKEKHARFTHWGVILASRGCKYACSFCFNFYRNSTRYRSTSSVINEMELLYRKGVQRVFFLDMTFSQNRTWVVALCNEMIARKNKLKWLCQTRCDCVDEELLSIMKKAGCCGVEFGVETYHDQALECLNKKVDTDRIIKAIQMCKKLQIETSAFLMIGTPYESKESVNNTIEMLKENGISFIPIIYTPRIGSKLGDEIAAFYHADTWEHLLGLRGKLSDNYDILEMIKDHSILKGESMGTVSTDFNHTNLASDMDHHRSQIMSSTIMREGTHLSEYIKNGTAKHNGNELPFISFPIISSCPFSCIYCGQGGENTISPVSTLKLETLMDIAVHLKRAGIKKIRLTGGEPLCHPQIGDIIRFLSESGFYVLINTNGVLIEEKLQSLMRTSSNIHFAVSLDTLKEERFDKISRTLGNYKKVIRGIKILKELGYLMRINMVVGSFNIDEVDDMISFCHDIGCDLKLQEVASVPYPHSEWNDIHTDLACLEHSLAKRADQVIVHEYARSFGIPVKVFNIDGMYVTLKAMSVGSRYDIDGICKDCPHLFCHEGLYDIYILADGSIATCRWCRFGGLETFDTDLQKAIQIFQNAEYVGSHQLTKMTRLESNNERINRL